MLRSVSHSIICVHVHVIICVHVHVIICVHVHVIICVHVHVAYVQLLYYSNWHDSICVLL